ncbi:MAG: choice-of-anchor C family protein [Phycisphaerae bacterium]|nr:choice-of-anchor C family protein [Phycisphaerae bacterium]
MSVPDGISWSQANDAAIASGGYLATCTSSAENDFVFSLVNTSEFWAGTGTNANWGPWLGAYQPEGSAEPAGGWHWVTEEAWGYTAWQSDQPDNLNDVEDRMHYFVPIGQSRAATWNDSAATALLKGFVIEFDPKPTEAVWPVNGHHYRAVSVPEGVTWDQANDAATAAGGYLATIGSVAENTFVFELTDAPQFWWDDPVNNRSAGPWLGGYQQVGASEPAGGWKWVTGQPLVYTNWCPSNPDDQLGGQNCLHFFLGGGLGRSGQWNDLWSDPGAHSLRVVGYVIEFPAQSPIVQNGSFEIGQDPGVHTGVGAGSAVIPEWVITGDVTYTGSYWLSSDGRRSLDMDAGGIAQTFPTIPGQKYVVIFELAGNPACESLIKELRVAAAGTSQTFTFNITGYKLWNMGWQTRSWEFTATEGRTTLEFQALDPGDSNCGPALDNVWVVISEAEDADRASAH